MGGRGGVGVACITHRPNIDVAVIKFSVCMCVVCVSVPSILGARVHLAE